MSRKTTVEEEKALDWKIDGAWEEKRALGHDDISETDFRKSLREAILRGGDKVMAELMEEYQEHRKEVLAKYPPRLGTRQLGVH